MAMDWCENFMMKCASEEIDLYLFVEGTKKLGIVNYGCIPDRIGEECRICNSRIKVFTGDRTFPIPRTLPRALREDSLGAIQ